MGKTTLARDLKTRLEKEGNEVVLAALAGGGEDTLIKLRRLATRDETLTDDARQATFFALAIEVVDKVIKPALAEGKIVIVDRYIASNYAYSYASDSDYHLVEFKRGYMRDHFPIPDEHVFITGSVETMRERLKGKKADVIEKHSDEYFEVVKRTLKNWVEDYQRAEFETHKDGPWVEFDTTLDTETMVSLLAAGVKYHKEKEKVNAKSR